MKKIFTFFLIIISVLMVGCSQNDESFDVSKITPPESNNIKILGEWEVTNNIYSEKTTDDSDITNGIFHLKSGDKIVIGKDKVVLNDISVENPNFKLKRMERDKFFQEVDDVEIKNEIKNTIKSDYVDITSIYDSNKTYINIISINNDEAYLLLSDKLVKLKKISDKLEEQSVVEDKNEKVAKSNDIKSNENSEYYNKDVGVLLGIKKPAKMEDGYYEASTYKTLWISIINDELQPINILDKSLLLPRINGFSNISLTSEYNGDEIENKLTVTSRKKDEKEVKGEQIRKGIYEEITFVGNDYIGLESYVGNNFDGQYNSYSITPIDKVDSVRSMDIANLFGKQEEENYNTSEKNAIQKYDVDGKSYYAQNKYSNITLQRKNGNWNLEGMLNNKKDFNDFRIFDININPVPILINYDTLMVPWSQVVSLGRGVRDIVTAPNGKIAITLSDSKLTIYKITDGRLGEKLGSIYIEPNEEIVMAEWAVGDYVKYWDETVENIYGAKGIDE